MGKGWLADGVPTGFGADCVWRAGWRQGGAGGFGVGGFGGAARRAGADGMARDADEGCVFLGRGVARFGGAGRGLVLGEQVMELLEQGLDGGGAGLRGGAADEGGDEGGEQAREQAADKAREQARLARGRGLDRVRGGVMWHWRGL